jgi:hypothetical protein
VKKLGLVLLLLSARSASAEEDRSLEEKYRVCQQFVGEMLAREMTRRHGAGEAPTRYLVAESVDEMLELLDNLSVLAGQGPVTPIQSDPDIYVKEAREKAVTPFK